MMGFNYMRLRGVEFPLWFVILILVLIFGTIIGVCIYEIFFDKDK